MFKRLLRKTEPAISNLLAPQHDRVETTLASLLPLEMLLEPNISQLRDTYVAAKDKTDCLVRYAKFFVARPDKLRLLDNPYFLNRHSGNAVFDLIIAARRYGLDELELAQESIRAHSNASEVPIFPMLLSRIQMAKGDRAGELETLHSMRERFPDDSMVTLYQLSYERRHGNFAEANRLLETVRPFVEASISGEIADTKASAADLAKALVEKRLVRAGEFDIYDDHVTRQTWASYYERFMTENRLQSRDGFLVQKLDNELTDIISSEGITGVLDFGSLCAEIIARPAAKCPNTHFVGIDRQNFVATLNEEAYSLPNLAFASGDIFDYLPQFASMSGKKALFHARTTTLLYPELVKKIYQSAADAGVDHIIGWEPNGLSRQYLKFFVFDDMPALSVPHTGIMMSHNYKQLLAETGYTITKVEHITSMVLCPTVDDLVWSTLLFRATRS